MADHLVLDGVDLVADRLDRQEIAVDDRIDQRVGEVVGLARPQAVGAAGLDALAHRVERIAGRSWKVTTKFSPKKMAICS